MLSPLMNNIQEFINETPFGGAEGPGGQVPLRMNHCSKTKCCEKEDDDDVCVCVFKCRGGRG